MTQMHAQTPSRDVILREDEYTGLLKEGSQDFGRWILAVVAEPSRLGLSGAVARFGEAANALETFLDDHGARHNRTFATFGEMVETGGQRLRKKENAQHRRTRTFDPCITP